MALVPTSEAEFQRAVTDLASVLGWRIFHPRRAQTGGRWSTPVGYDGAGFPDLTLVRDRLVMAELKSERGQLTADQKVWVGMLADAGVEVHVWRPQDWDEIERTLKRQVI
jgi:hypothetical protein